MKAKSRTMSMHADEESDEGTVPMKRSNNGSLLPAEIVEGRASPKENGGQATAVRTLCRGTASSRLEAVRQAARQDKKVRFTALLHHITVDLLTQSYNALKRDAAPGIDGVTWQAYGENLDEKLKALHDRIWQLSRPPGQTDLHSEGRRLATALECLVPGGQDRPTGGRESAGSDLRGGLRRLLLRVPAGAWPA
jgi:RNA-directed DNA polymerase